MIGLADSLANAEADKVTATVDGGGAAGQLTVYSGDRPATPADVPTGSVLAVFTLPYPSATAATAGAATWSFATGASATTATISTTGTPTWFRVVDSTGAVVFDGDVGTSGADLNFASLVWVVGQTVDLTDGTTQAG